MRIDDFLIQLVKYWIRKNDLNAMDAILAALNQAPLLFQYFTNWLNSQQDFISLFHFYRNWVLNFDFLFHNVSSRLELAG